MIFGLMSLKTYTVVHVLISLVAIIAGLALLRRIIDHRPFGGWNRVFMVTIVATCLTGFLFPFHHMTPGIVLGILTLLVLALAVYALEVKLLMGRWAAVYVYSVVAALYFDFFVAIVQSFQKIPYLRVRAPTQTEPPFLITQLVILVVLVLVGFFAQRRFRRTL
ncbi:MAG TPA: hypothetical protein VMI56_26350 [Reyranella sp.]|nr:hypothetical protein [Reyranella sp.]